MKIHAGLLIVGLLGPFLPLPGSWANSSYETFADVSAAFKKLHGAPVFPYTVEGRAFGSTCFTVVVSPREMHRRCRADRANLTTGFDIGSNASDQDITGILAFANREELEDLRAELDFVSGGWTSQSGTLISRRTDPTTGIDTLLVRVRPRDATLYDIALDANTMRPLFAVIDPGSGHRNIPVQIKDVQALPFRITNWRVGERSFYLSVQHQSKREVLKPLDDSTWQIESEASVVPVRADLAWPSVDIHINKLTFRFILDTGTEVSSISPSAVKQLGIPLHESITYNMGQLPIVSISRIKLGSATIDNARFLVASVPKGFDGILGSEILLRRPTVLDFERSQILIGNTIPSTTATTLGTLRHVPIVAFTIDDTQTRGIIATGTGEMTVVNDRLRTAEHVSLDDEATYRRTNRFGQVTRVRCGFTMISLGGAQSTTRARTCLGESVSVDDEVTKLGIVAFRFKRIGFDVQHHRFTWLR